MKETHQLSQSCIPGLIIREAEPSDAAALLAYVDALIAEQDIDIPLQPGEFNISLQEEERIMRDYSDAQNSVFLVAVAEGEIIGQLGIQGGKRQALSHAGELGMSVARSWRGEGVGQALMAEALRWANERSTLKRIELKVYVRNAAAVHIYEKYGFEIEGCRRKAVFQDEVYLDDYIMARLID